MPEIRLQKIIAAAGVCSRRKAEELIRAGRVKVDGRIVKELGSQADPERQRIAVDDKVIQQERKVYLLMNKPSGVITSRKDEADRKVVFDLVEETRRLVSVGRLDYYTEGALILTNDGDLVHKLTHPSSQIIREYEVKVKGRLSAEQISRIEQGVLLEDGPALPVVVEKIKNTEKNAWYSFLLKEGRNREVRRIVEAVGSKVLKLVRTSFAGLRVDDLPVGDTRPLTPVEILSLFELANLWRPDKDVRNRARIIPKPRRSRSNSQGSPAPKKKAPRATARPVKKGRVSRRKK